MACRFTYQGKTYNQDGLVNALKDMSIEHAKKYIPGINVPDMPFKQTEQWAGLALKRMIHKAVEEGKTRISWTPGEAQAARYDLSKQIDMIAWNPETGRLDAWDKSGHQKIIERNVPKEKLADFIGKEATDKIVNSPTKKQVLSASAEPTHILENADLKVGGEGMKGFYDTIMPKIAENIGKQYGVKVKQGEIPPKAKPYQKYGTEWGSGVEGDRTTYRTREEAEKAIPKQNVHYFDIPPKMAEDVRKNGLKLFEDSGKAGAALHQDQSDHKTKKVKRPEEQAETNPKINVPERAAGGRVLASNIASPTPAQAKAGNYAKDHVNILGLNVTIENAKGSIRSGVGPDGKVWKCRLPAHYGYLKSTEGADNDHLDVYLGPHKTCDKVFVINQIDKDTKQFDETKTMLCFGSLQQALTCYQKAFSDGKGFERIGSIVPATVSQFKQWCREGNTKRPFVLPKQTLH